MKKGYVYIMASGKNGTLYTGVTSDLLKRVYQHKNNIVEGFTSKYNIHMLVYYEEFIDIRTAIEREKNIKGLTRRKKLFLIESNNPDWKDLSKEWYQIVKNA